MQGKLSISGDVFTLLLVAQRGNGPKGDIAVDDVWMDNGVCTPDPTQVEINKRKKKHIDEQY